MKIGVLVKQVPDTESQIQIKKDSSGIDESGVKFVMNAYDEIALEEALKMKEKAGGEVVVVTLGPARAADAIRQALAMGADRAIHVKSNVGFQDANITALAIAKACDGEKFDIMFAGKQSTDEAAGFVHIAVAARLHIPHISPVEKFEFDADSKKVKVIRPMAGSIKDTVEATLPVLIGCEKGLNSPRYATLPGIMKARTKRVDVVEAENLIAGEVSKASVISYEPPPARKPGRLVGGSAAEAAVELAKLLRDEAKVI